MVTYFLDHFASNLKSIYTTETPSQSQIKSFLQGDSSQDKSCVKVDSSQAAPRIVPKPVQRFDMLEDDIADLLWLKNNKRRSEV